MVFLTISLSPAKLMTILRTKFVHQKKVETVFKTFNMSGYVGVLQVMKLLIESSKFLYTLDEVILTDFERNLLIKKLEAFL